MEMKKLMKAFLAPALALALTACGNSDLDVAKKNGAKPLTQAEAQAALTDHTLIGSIPHLNLKFSLYYAQGGRLIGAVSGPIKGRDRGAWRVADDGQVCLRWSDWEDGEEKCRVLWRDGAELKIFEDKSGRAVSIARATPGNTQKLQVQSDLELVQGQDKLQAAGTDELKAALAGNTLTGRTAKGDTQHVYYAADGRTWLSIPEDVIKDHGTYRIADGGQVCTTFSYLYAAHERCDRWLKSDKGYSVFDPYGKLALVGNVQPGNPEKLGQ